MSFSVDIMNADVKKISNAINKLASEYQSKTHKSIKLMEVCGTHTMSIAKYGLRQLLPENVELLSGPGCPVCVTSNDQIDYMIELARQPKTIVTTFGDMMRVPGSYSNLLKEKSLGADVRIVYSPIDALNIAIKESKIDPKVRVVFIGVGFETTAPLSAAVIKKAKELNVDNFFVYCAHKNMPGAMELIVNDENLKVDGFILPGHVSTIVGLQPFEFLADEYKVPGVVSGFEASEIMTAIYMLCKQVVQGESKIQNAYSSAVRNEGNIDAQNIIDGVFETVDTSWRGLGTIHDSGYKIRNEYSQFDAEKVFQINPPKSKEHSGCRCGEILKGIILPTNCPLFSKTCNPENPIGPCMVSGEGTCAAYYRYNL